MSNRLAISASFSVLMMSIFVLFGTDDAHAQITPESFAAPVSATAPGLATNPERLPLILR